MSIRKKFVIAAAGGVTVVILVLILLSTFYLRKTVSYSGSLLGEVKAELQINRGENGVPHIVADTMEDAYFAVGFLHAQDRFLAVEYFRALANGKLSSFTGRSGINVDRLARLIGFSRDARILFDTLDQESKNNLEAYARGINFFTQKKAGEISGLLQMPGEIWTAYDVIAVLLMYNWVDSFRNNREQVFLVSPGANTKHLKKLFPEPLTFYYAEEEKNDVLLLKEIRNLLSDRIGPFLSGFGIYVPSQNANDGKAVSAFSYESGSEIYPRWYPVTITVKNAEISGVTTAGVPFVIAGKNRAIGFSSFNLSVDTQDYHRETVKNSEQGEQFFNRGIWKSFDTKTETIPVRNERSGNGNISLKLRFKDGWPVVSDLFSEKIAADVITMTFLRPDAKYVKSLFDVPLAGSVDDAAKTVRNIPGNPRLYLFSSPDKAMVAFAGQVPAKYPQPAIFQKGETYYPAPAYDISSAAVSSKKETVITGSHFFDNEPAPVKNNLYFKDTNRLDRLSGLLEGGSGLLGAQDIQKSLLDNNSAIARKFVPVFSSILERVPIPSARLFRIYFKNWNYDMGKDSVPAALSQVLLKNMIQETIIDELRDDAAEVLACHYYLIENFHSIMQDDSNPLFDDQRTGEKIENRNTIFDRAFMKTLKYFNSRRGPYMEKWKWGIVHLGLARNPFREDGASLTQKLMKGEGLPDSGDDSTLWRSSVRYDRDFKSGDITALSGVMAGSSLSVSVRTGISMNPFSEYYASVFEKKPYLDLGSTSWKYRLVISPKGK